MKYIVMIPTYNEAANIEALVRELRAMPLQPEVLVVDDNSPDGTARVVEQIAAADPHVHLLLRTERRGRGWAGIDGFKKALEMGADAVLEMDGDHSHAPRFIPSFAAKLGEADIVIGSRYVSGGADEERTLLRQVVSNCARRYLALVLGVNVQDPTSGYRMFTRAAVEKLVPLLSARDPFIVTEILYRSKLLGLKVAEVPIEFKTRNAGESKLKPATLFKYLLRVWKLKLSR